MTASGLRREAGRGRLVIERAAGKDYTTLAEYRTHEGVMPRSAKGARLWLRPEERNLDGTLRKRAVWAFEMDRARSSRAALQRIARAPSARSASSLPTNTNPAAPAAVIPLKS